MEFEEFFHYLSGGLFILSGGGLIVWQALAMERAAASRRWPRASGKVLRVFVAEKEGGEGPVYLVKVLCQYRVGDSEYTCDRLRFGIALWNDRWIARLSRTLKKYTAGDKVEIAYDPEKPEESVLEPGFAPTLLSGFGLGFVVFIAGILVLRQ
jgi:Protein of unknown function (DUF3592)